MSVHTLYRTCVRTRNAQVACTTCSWSLMFSGSRQRFVGLYTYTTYLYLMNAPKARLKARSPPLRSITCLVAPLLRRTRVACVFRCLCSLTEVVSSRGSGFAPFMVLVCDDRPGFHGVQFSPGASAGAAQRPGRCRPAPPRASPRARRVRASAIPIARSTPQRASHPSSQGLVRREREAGTRSTRCGEL